MLMLCISIEQKVLEPSTFVTHVHILIIVLLRHDIGEVLRYFAVMRFSCRPFVDVVYVSSM